MFEFQERFSNKASEDELKEIYYRAQQDLAENITIESLETLIPQSPLDYLITKTESQATENVELKKGR